jgi:hypothetical protein
VTDNKKKRELYFSGAPIQDDASKPLPGEITPERRRAFIFAGSLVGCFCLGLVLGLALAPQTPAEILAKNEALEEELQSAQKRITDLERTVAYKDTVKPITAGKLPADIRARNQQGIDRIAIMMKRFKAQGASELMEWFGKRWNDLLDHPEPEDRTGRRAATLALLIGGMAENMHPQDFVEWQASFFRGNWLAELHYDIDGDGLPGSSNGVNPKDGFANVSVCQVAMALNQSVTDTQILVTPDMRCDRPQSRISLFLQGSTFKDAIDEFVEAAEQEGFLVVQRREKNVRLILIGTKRGS